MNITLKITSVYVLEHGNLQNLFFLSIELWEKRLRLWLKKVKKLHHENETGSAK